MVAKPNSSLPLCCVFQTLLWPPLPAEGLAGYLMRAIPPNACHAVENPPAPRKASEKYIALIQGCGCSFAEKVLHAQQAGYQAAVVYNVDSEQLITMTSDDKEIQQQIEIPSLFTGESSLPVRGKTRPASPQHLLVTPHTDTRCPHASGGSAQPTAEGSLAFNCPG
uniref:PA domain-containing protein n=1 Tax=Anser cygnoides TaxID=8845 RepID=A0A8B9EDF9_ANSCY